MNRPPDHPLDTLAFSLMKTLVAITGENWVSVARFTDIADSWNLQDPADRIRLLTGVLRLIRNMPIKVFTDLEKRQAILQTAQEALDMAITVEEGLD